MRLRSGMNITVPLQMLLVERWAFSLALYRMPWRYWSKFVIDSISWENPLLNLLKKKGTIVKSKIEHTK